MRKKNNNNEQKEKKKKLYRWFSVEYFSLLAIVNVKHFPAKYMNMWKRDWNTSDCFNIFKKKKTTSLPLNGTMMCRTLFNSQINYGCVPCSTSIKIIWRICFCQPKIVWTLNSKSFHWLRLSQIKELRTNCANRFSFAIHSFHVFFFSLSATTKLKKEHLNVKLKLWQSVLRRMRKKTRTIIFFTFWWTNPNQRRSY